MLNRDILSFILGFHVIWLLETKTACNFSVPGYYVYQNPSGLNAKRGGIAMLLKCFLIDYVKEIDTGTEGQIWLELSCYPDYKFGGVYIPPKDSPYYEPSMFGALLANIMQRSRVVIMGDLNSRVGVPYLTDLGDKPYQYNETRDFVVNDNGKQLLDICKNSEMLIANHLVIGDKILGGNLSYKQGSRWISEIDLCLVKSEIVKEIESVSVEQGIHGSDHAPLSVMLEFDIKGEMARSLLLDSASNLGKSYSSPTENRFVCSGPSFRFVDVNGFQASMNSLTPPNISNNADTNVSVILDDCHDLINSVAKSNPSNQSTHDYEWDQRYPRWKRLLENNDSRVVWKAIGWKGEIAGELSDGPTDSQFKAHFEELLNPSSEERDAVFETEGAPYIPVLDDPFTADELGGVVRGLKTNKSYVGICPALFTILPQQWMLFFLTIFNWIFCYGFYPFAWCHNKLITLFKSGDKHECGNYRGISVMNTLAKVYDMLIMKRLSIWCSIDKCQAGAQKGRGCVEQILSLRLLIDLAKSKKEKLYVLFVDYSKAYDKVPRLKLLEYLKSLGCGKRMLLAIQGMYKCTRNILKSALIESSIGVRQGAPTSCLLFVIYIDKMIKMLKERIGNDGYLGSLHAMLLMDDTVLIATSRDMCIRKLEILLDYCSEYGMSVNVKKTKYFVINGNEADKHPICTHRLTVEYCSKYLYLGGWFTDKGEMKSVLKLHETSGSPSAHKFSMFCALNSSMPFEYKLKVFRAALTSSLLYSSESWITSNVKCIETLYNRMVRMLLGVRNNTPIHLCLIEVGLNTAKYEIEKKRKAFLTSKFRNINLDEPFHIVFEMCRVSNTPGYRFLYSCMQEDVIESLEEIREVIMNKPDSATKFETYRRKLNLGLAVHEVYRSRVYVPDYVRVSFTRLRLMSHNLRVETGRWSRLQREERVCICDNETVQDEKHVLLDCPLVAHIRQNYQMLDYTDVASLLGGGGDTIGICNYVHKIMRYF